MCYCLFAIFSCTFFLSMVCYEASTILLTTSQMMNGDLALSWWLIGLCFVWILAD